MKVEWTDDLLTGVKEIDEQHKELFQRVNALFDAIVKGRSKEEVGSLIDFLEVYTVKHFGDEESLMKKYDYPGYSGQKAEHNIFIADIAKIRSEYKSAGVNMFLLINIQRRMSEWLTKHLKGSDKLIGNFLKSKL